MNGHFNKTKEDCKNNSSNKQDCKNLPKFFCYKSINDRNANQNIAKHSSCIFPILIIKLFHYLSKTKPTTIGNKQRAINNPANTYQTSIFFKLTIQSLPEVFKKSIFFHFFKINQKNLKKHLTFKKLYIIMFMSAVESGKCPK